MRWTFPTRFPDCTHSPRHNRRVYGKLDLPDALPGTIRTVRDITDASTRQDRRVYSELDLPDALPGTIRTVRDRTDASTVSWTFPTHFPDYTHSPRQDRRVYETVDMDPSRRMLGSMSTVSWTFPTRFPDCMHSRRQDRRVYSMIRTFTTRHHGGENTRT